MPRASGRHEGMSWGNCAAISKWLTRSVRHIFPVAMRLGETPVLIPNTMVKTWAADGTRLETVWESRWLPDLLKKHHLRKMLRYAGIYQWFKVRETPDFEWLINSQSRMYLENRILKIISSIKYRSLWEPKGSNNEIGKNKRHPRPLRKQWKNKAYL